MNTFSPIYQKAIFAVVEASTVIMEFYERGFESELKTDGSPVTEADIASSNVISQILVETGIPILGEETEHQSFEIRKNWTQNWCVDPLDGTKEYIKKNGEFAVNIALIENNRPVFGVIAWPTQQKVLFGDKFTGVFISSFESIQQPERWSKMKSNEVVNNPLIMAISHSKNSGASIEFIKELKKEYPIIQFLSKGSALKFFDLAEGKADIYPRFAPTMEWDIAAGQAILEALGGEICDVNSGEPLHYNKEDLFNPYFVARTKPLIKQHA